MEEKEKANTSAFNLRALRRSLHGKGKSKKNKLKPTKSKQALSGKLYAKFFWVSLVVRHLSSFMS